MANSITSLENSTGPLVPSMSEQTVSLNVLLSDIDNAFPNHDDEEVQSSPYDHHLPGWSTGQLPQGGSALPNVPAVQRPFSDRVKWTHDTALIAWKGNSCAINNGLGAAIAGGAGVYCILATGSQDGPAFRTRSRNTNKKQAIGARFHRVNQAGEVSLSSIEVPFQRLIDADPSNGADVRFYTLTNQRTNRPGYFVQNPRHGDFFMNGVRLGPLQIAGPLPDFVVMEVGNGVLLWWPDRRAIFRSESLKSAGKRKRDDVEDAGDTGENPPKRRRCEDIKSRIRAWLESYRSGAAPPAPSSSAATVPDKDAGAVVDLGDEPESLDQESSSELTGPGTDEDSLFGGSPPAQTVYDTESPTSDNDNNGPKIDESSELSELTDGPPSPTSWKELLERDIDHYIDALFLKDENPNKLGSLPLDEEPITLAIGSLWAALRKHTPFGFGVIDLFRQTTAEEKVFYKLTACGIRADRFIVPLLLKSKEQEEALRRGVPTDSIGHFVLVVASRVEESGVPKIGLTVYNSLPEFASQEAVERLVKDVIFYSEWCPAVLGPTPAYAPIVQPDSPRQGFPVTCGIHAILNGWAAMLDIGIVSQERRRDTGYTESQFLTQARKVINLALAGCIDSHTIQAFLNEYGYSVEQEYRDESNRPVLVTTRSLTPNRLLDEVEEDKEEDAKHINAVFSESE